MRKLLLIITIFQFANPIPGYSWGKEAHEIVAKIAFHFLDDSTKNRLLNYLDGMSIEKASTWMDEIRSDMKYNYMKPWHFLAFDKNTEEEVLGERNVVTVLNETIFSMKDSSKEKTKQNLLIVIHLIGDLHQPMHVGYNDDKGGNTIRLKYKGSTKILHAIWDGDLIRDGNIIYESCLALNNKLKVNVSSIDVFKWATDSRLLLSDVYNYKNNEIDKNYINNAKPVIEKQLLLAGMRLAYILNTRLK